MSKATILPPRGCDDEVAAIMDRLDKLQTFLVLNRQIEAATLIQDTRVLIVERLYPANAARRAVREC